MFGSHQLRRGVQNRLAATATCQSVFRSTGAYGRGIAVGLVDPKLQYHQQHHHVGRGNYQRRQHYHTYKFPMEQRNLLDTMTSGFYGMVALVTSESNRKDFIEAVTDQVIHNTVATQARFGNVLSLALYYDLYQNPVWKKTDFKPTEFLEGVVPALEQFHEIQGLLINEFPAVDPDERAELVLKRLSQLVSSSGIASQQIEGSKKKNSSNEDEASMKSSESSVEQEGERLLPDNSWADQAKKDPDSLAGQFSRMVTPSVLDADYLSAETAAFFKTYQTGSTYVENVALLSARAIEVEDDQEYDEEVDGSVDDKVSESKEQLTETHKSPMKDENENKNESIKGNGSDKSNDIHVAVAAQIEVLYDVKRTFIPKKFTIKEGEEARGGEEEKSEQETDEHQKPIEQTQVIVGTFEGWLRGGPDGALRWRISKLRVPYIEFPGLLHS